MFETLKGSRILRQRPPHSLRGRLIMGTGLGGTSRTHVFCLSLPKTWRFVNSSLHSTNETFDRRDEILAQGHIAMSLESAPRSVWAWAEPSICDAAGVSDLRGHHASRGPSEKGQLLLSPHMGRSRVGMRIGPSLELTRVAPCLPGASSQVRLGEAHLCEGPALSLRIWHKSGCPGQRGPWGGGGELEEQRGAVSDLSQRRGGGKAGAGTAGDLFSFLYQFLVHRERGLQVQNMSLAGPPIHSRASRHVLTYICTHFVIFKKENFGRKRLGLWRLGWWFKPEHLINFTQHDWADEIWDR